MPNAIVNIERNGGFGSSLLSKLITTKIKRNLYYEIKERVIEERFDGIHTVKTKQKVKVYGSDNTKETRSLLMEILRDRVQYHKDKFNSDIIYNEMRCMEVKKDGRIEHSSNTHDDQVFSYLWALYVWYYGKNTMENWGLYRSDLQCEEGADEEIIKIDDNDNTTIQLDQDPDDEFNIEINKGIAMQEESIAHTMSFESWIKSEYENDKNAMKKLLSTPIGKRAVENATGVKYDENDPMYNGLIMMPDDIYDMGYDENITEKNKYNMTNISELYKSKNKITSDIF